MSPMWDKDKEMGRQLVGTFSYGDEFIVFGVSAEGEVAGKPGLPPARKTRITVARLASPREQFDVTTLGSAIADKAALATDEDFPVVVQLLQADTDKGNPATVLQFVRVWDGTLPS